MPITDQNQQMAMLQQAIKQAMMQQQMMQSGQLLNGGGNPGNPGGPALGGAPPVSMPQTPGMASQLAPTAGLPAQQGSQPPTLGIGRPLPMQMPNPDPQGEQMQQPLPPEGAM